MSANDLNALAERLNDEWQDDPNVVRVWIGIRRHANRIVAGPTLCFGVLQKYASEEEIRAAGSTPIPSEIEGVQTDLVVLKGTSAYLLNSRGRKAISPLKGGGSTAPLGSIFPFPTGGGTLGGVCYQHGQAMAISNAHVWGFDLGCEIIQPIIPLEKFGLTLLDLLRCGPLIAYLKEGVAPSVLTSVLATAAAATWMIAGLADEKDPHRRGQEATQPAQAGELTQMETVKFEAEPGTLPLPGLPYQGRVAWDYARQTNLASYPFSVNETRTNQHILVRQHLWSEGTVFRAGETVTLRAVLETQNIPQPEAFHVTARLIAKHQPDRHSVRILHKRTIKEWPFLGVSLALGAPESPAQFPIQRDGILFRADEPGTFRDWWPRDNPDGLVALQLPKDGLKIDLLPPAQAQRADLQVVQLDPAPITLSAFDAQGNLLDSLTTPGRAGVQHLLKVRGPGISRMELTGGNGMALLRWVSLNMPDYALAQPLYPHSNLLCYEGRFTLKAGELPDQWSGMLSAQSASVLPATTPALQAAASISGIESAILATTEAPCTICLALDDLFSVL